MITMICFIDFLSFLLYVCVSVCVCEVGELDHDIYGTPVYVALEVFDTHTQAHTHTYERCVCVLIYIQLQAT